jgi:hypothetical protein
MECKDAGEWNWFKIISNGRLLVSAALNFLDVPSPVLVCQLANTLSLTNTVQTEFEITPSPIPQPANGHDHEPKESVKIPAFVKAVRSQTAHSVPSHLASIPRVPSSSVTYRQVMPW